jgi:ABC-type sugar transport systems, permease components
MKRSSIDYWQRVAFMIPVLFIIVVFVAYPFLSSIYYSFTDWNGISKPDYVGLLNYRNLLKDTSFLHALRNILFFTLGTIVIINPLSLGLALILNSNIKGRSALRTLFYLPSIISLIVISNVWVLILSYDGMMNKIMELVGAGSLMADWLGDYDKTPWVMLFIILWQGVGNSAVFYIAGLQSVPAELYEAADIDGVGKWGRFRHITFPLLMPAVTIVTFFQLSGTLKLFDLPLIMTQGGPGDVTLTPTMLIYDQAFQYNVAGYATTTGVFLLIIIFAVSAVQLWLTRSKEVEM